MSRMRHDFDRVLDRRQTHSLKWDYCERSFGLEDVIPMWVADMDFAAPPAVVDALRSRAGHGAYGYASTPESFWQAAIDWLARRHHWDVKRAWLSRSPGVVPALSLCVNAFTSPGDGVVVQPPVYYPFFRAAENNGRRLVRNPLVADGVRYVMDLDDLESRLDARTRLLILCSPHNPVGRVWTRAELEALGEVCERHDLIVLADEIHMDLVLPGHAHVPFASLSERLAARTMTCVAPSKTFNIAGLATSLVVSSNPDLLSRYEQQLRASGLGMGNLFGTIGLEAAYSRGAAWLDDLLEYLEGNVDLTERFLTERLPMLHFVRPEGTYLALIDCRALGMDQPALDNFFMRSAKVYFDSGPMFGPEAAGFERINLGCPRATLLEALERMARAIGSLGARPSPLGSGL